MLLKKYRVMKAFRSLCIVLSLVLISIGLYAQNNKYAEVLTHGEELLELGDFENAKKAFLEVSLDALTPDSLLFKANYNLCMLHLLADDISGAALYGETARSIVRSKLGAETQYNLTITELLSFVYEMTGNTSALISCKKDALQYYILNRESPHQDIAFAQYALARAYRDDNDYVSELQALEQTKQSFKELLSIGDERKNQVTELVILNIDSERLFCLSACGEREKASALYEDIKERFQEVSNSQNAITLEVNSNLSNYLLSIDDPSGALVYMKHILEFMENNPEEKEKNIDGYKNALWRTGFLQYMSDEEPEEAKDNLKKYLRLSRDSDEDGTILNYERLVVVSKLLANTGDKDTGEILNYLIHDTKSIVSRIYKELGKEEREKLWSSHFENKDDSFISIKNILLSYRDRIQNDALIYDYLLLAKGILLNSALNDNLLVSKYGTEEEVSQWRHKRHNEEAISRGQELGVDSMIIDSLRFENAQIERMIHNNGHIDKAIGDYYNESFATIKDRLNDNDVIIDFVTYVDEDSKLKSTGAYVIRNSISEPVYIPLFDDNTASYINRMDNKTIFSRDELQDQLYEDTWGKLQRFIKKRDHIYMVSDGCINSLPIEYLNKFIRLSKNKKLITNRVSSAKTIFHLSDIIQLSTACIYGGIDYDAPLYISSPSDTVSTTFTGITIQDSRTRGTNWNYLPFTKSETSSIYDILSHSDVDAVLYQDRQGREEELKKEDLPSPSLIHLATHGYYVDPHEALKIDPLPSELNEKERVNYADFHEPVQDYALIRSGLIMAGGNNTWKNGSIEVAANDGILTSQEVLNIDLNNTQLVVLSACNSGLGDIKSDGVFGLQRAFKSAGVQSIIMSLWPVDDKATSMLMECFYDNLIKTGSKHDSLIKAIERVRSNYKDPYYWAAFIMLD